MESVRKSSEVSDVKLKGARRQRSYQHPEVLKSWRGITRSRWSCYEFCDRQKTIEGTELRTVRDVFSQRLLELNSRIACNTYQFRMAITLAGAHHDMKLDCRCTSTCAAFVGFISLLT